MDLDAFLLRRLCMPIGAFIDSSRIKLTGIGANEDSIQHGASATSWDSSQTNPANRVLALTRPAQPSWRVEGCDGQGTQLQVLPVFLLPRLRPLRIDVFLPNQSRWPPAIRDVLDSGIAFCIRDDRVAALGISKLVVQALDHWASDCQDFERKFHALPFGSRIVVENISINPAAMRVRMIPDCRCGIGTVTFSNTGSLGIALSDSCFPLGLFSKCGTCLPTPGPWPWILTTYSIPSSSTIPSP